MVKDDVIRDLSRQSMQGLEDEPTMVLADALLETNRPDLGEDLALILSDRRPFPRELRGQPMRRSEADRALGIVFRRIHRRFAWSPYDREEQVRALRELNVIGIDFWNESAAHRNDEIARAVDWLESDIAPDHVLHERTTWLLNGTFGRGAQILAEEIVDAPPSHHSREAQLFRLVLAFDDNLPPNATNRVWDQLSARAKRHATTAIQQVIQDYGGELHTPAPRATTRRRKR